MVLVFRDKASFDTIKADIVVTPDLDGGVGPVALGEPAVGADGRCVVSHPWAEIDADWLSAYTSGANPAVQVLDALPSDWVWPEVTQAS